MPDMHQPVTSAVTTEPPFRCPVCDGLLNGPIVAREVLPAGEVAIRRCPHCGLHLTWPRLADPQSGYLQSTVAQWQAKYGPIERGERLHDRHLNYLEEVEVVRHYLPAGRLLDVGCNAGWLLGYLRQPGVFELEGLEPSPVLAQIARQRLDLPVHNCYLHQLEGREATFDGLLATDVIEHILPEDFNPFLESVARLLKPGGYFFAKTPNVYYLALKSRLSTQLPAAARRVMLKAQDVWNAKEHVIHWDVASLTRILGQHQLEPLRFFVPRPVETTNSPLGARLARKAIYWSARLYGSQHGVPFFAQDIFIVARKAH